MEIWHCLTFVMKLGNPDFGRDIPCNGFAPQSIRSDILAGSWSLTRKLMLESKLSPMVKQVIAPGRGSSFINSWAELSQNPLDRFSYC